MALDDPGSDELPEQIESDEVLLETRLGRMFNVATVTALVWLVPAALIAGSGHFGESFDERLFAVVYASPIALGVLLCLWDPFARRAKLLDGFWWC